MTSLPQITHTRSPRIEYQRPSNIPVCRNPQIIYAPSHIESTLEGGQLIVKGDWHFGISGEDSCSPISLKLTVADGKISAEAVRVDSYSGIHEPVRLKPSMINGFVAGLNEHFRTHDGQERDQEDTYVVDTDEFISGVGAEVQRIIDDRFGEPLAPCVQPRQDTPVAIGCSELECPGR